MLNQGIIKRISFLLKSENVNKDWNFLVELQKEQAPWLSQEEVVECVIYSIVKNYKDYSLSWMWYNQDSVAFQQAA